MHGGTFVAIGMAALSGMVAGPAQGQTPRERGAYLVTSIAACGNCHTPRDAAINQIPGMSLAGGFKFDVAGLGHIVGPNITPDPSTGIGAWTDGQIVNALRNGKRPDGTIIGPPMPIDFYSRISDNDAAAITAYLKSIKAVRHEVARSQYPIPLPPAYGPVVDHVDEPVRTDKIAYGGYLAGPVGHCMECHTPHNGPAPDMSRLGAGGFTLPDFGEPGATTVSRNITPDPDTGIGKWSDADIKRAIVSGVRPDGTKLARTMDFASYKRMTSDDLNAVVAYLRSLPPVKMQ
jgi:mono/diheme cytochrome c family protein